MPTFEELEQQVMSLPKSSRRELAERLWDSVATEEEQFTPEQLAQFDRRTTEFEQGNVTTYSHEEVMRGMGDLLRAR